MPSDLLVTWAALVAGSLCFALYLAASIAALMTKQAAMKAADLHQRAIVSGKSVGLTIDELTKLLGAVSKLTDSLAKAGPALTSLIGSILFFAIAALSSGALRSAPTPQPSTAPTLAAGASPRSPAP